MKKVEAIIRPEKMESVKEALGKYGIHGMTVTEVIGCGLQKGWVGTYRGQDYSLNLLPKVKIEIVIQDHRLDEVLRVVSEAARSGEIGDGKIFVLNIENVIRIRTGETGESAVGPS
ncbi:MAG: P-II family nitrogen regulator [Peptococcaceae bacterium]|nr:P-II family nitrogen regulator [Peptococcaceae bacterium]